MSTLLAIAAIISTVFVIERIVTIAAPFLNGITKDEDEDEGA